MLYQLSYSRSMTYGVPTPTWGRNGATDKDDTSTATLAGISTWSRRGGALWDELPQGSSRSQTGIGWHSWAAETTEHEQVLPVGSDLAMIHGRRRLLSCSIQQSPGKRLRSIQPGAG